MNTGYSKIDKQEKANKLFGKTAIAKAIWIVCLPGLLAAFFAGLYRFFWSDLNSKISARSLETKWCLQRFALFKY